MKMRCIEIKGKKQIIFVPETVVEEELVKSLTEDNCKTFIVRKAKYTESPLVTKNALIIKDSHRAIKEYEKEKN